MKHKLSTAPASLRHAAEARLKEQPASHPAKSETDLRRLQHELEVHQIELEMRNEELRAARDKTAEDLERYTELYDFAPVGYFTFTTDGTVRAVNLLGASLVGLERGRLVGRNFREFVAEADRQVFRDFLARVLAGDSTQSCEVRLVRAATVLRVSLVEGLSSPDRRECRAVLVDITERRQAELSLRESETRLRLSVAASQIGLWDWNLPTNEVYFSPEWKAQIGHADDEISNRFEEWESRVHPDDLPSIMAKLRAYVADPGAGYAADFRLRHKDGSYRWIFTQAQLFRDATQKPVRMLGCHLDITERKRAEDDLRLQAAALAAAANEVVITDREGIIQWVNPAFTKTTGYTFEEAVGQNPRLLKSGKHDRAFYKKLWDTLLSGEVWHGEIVNQRKDGSLYPEETIITPVKDQQGTITNFIAIKQDITEKKLLEAKFLRAQRLEGLGALAGGVAHDLNNVLAPILMASELLKAQSNDPQTSKLLDMIQTNSERGAGMIRQILAFARGSVGEKIAMQVSHLLKEIFKLMQQTFPPNIRCELRVASGLELVLGETTELYQVLLNLCVNARDAMPKGGTITLGAENIVLDETYARLSHEAPPGHYVVLTVADTGSGFPTEIQGKVFDPFFTTKQPGKGTGLGLATVKDIVTGHGGFIHLYSEVGVGTQFKIYLPVAQGEEATEETTFLALPGGHGELVLVVDDEAAVREIVKATLENYGYRVVTADDGTQGVARFVEHLKEVQLLLTDIQMPHMDGMALIRALRNIQPGLRVIAASGLSTHEAALKAVGINVQAFIVKPFTAASLLLALDAALHPK